ncbi:PREDICTED: putative zinc finger and SCAN domain-containing protein 5D [Rhinopithecus bieti]|uniref:putative zinc finger and SCAN domain-containing protein 5D n=1 Tax=Rhinopithecus bieti TaxID=61621 RepID=UPI00083BEFC7|nr:PREDICTED: putative zinc finger and SCAN domain-containing protein 5D [Rhinopithecus bieti]
MDYMALNQSWGGAGNRKPGLESLHFSINRRSSAPGQLESASQSEEVGGRRREGDMAANCTSSWRQREPCNRPGLELPRSMASSETELGNHNVDPEISHVNFRMFTCPEESDPIQALRKLTELCHLWLRPDLHTKEQILDMLVMEQFMISMPQELQVLVKVNSVQSCKDLEDLLRNNRRPKKWVSGTLLIGVVGAKEGQEPQKRASVENVDADTPSACVVEREASTHSGNRGNAPNLRGPKRSKLDATSISQEGPPGGATPAGNRESLGQAGINPVHFPGPARAGSQPVGQEAKELLLFACGVCSKRFMCNSKLVLHKRSHTGERPFQCNVCERCFMQLSDLRVHQRIHTGEKPYTCDVCHKRFNRRFSLKCHKRSHTGEKPYKCKDCKKVFTYRKNLNEHKLIHSGEKPYQCSKCSRAFRRPETLKYHQKTHPETTAPRECEG